MNLPNKITTFRMVLVVILVAILLLPFDYGMVGNSSLSWKYLIAFIIFIVASISDYFDGHIARKYNLITTYGKFMDPIADKLLVNSSFIIMATQTPDMVPVIAVVIMIARDIVVDALRMISVQKGIVIAANIFGKLKTVTQMIAIILAFLDVNKFAEFLSGNLDGMSLILNILWSGMMLISVIATVFSGWDYLKNGKDLLKDK